MKPPLLAARGSVLGCPSEVTSQPAGVGRFSLALLRILPAATVVVAMSSRKGWPGPPGPPKGGGAVRGGRLVGPAGVGGPRAAAAVDQRRDRRFLGDRGLCRHVDLAVASALV